MHSNTFSCEVLHRHAHSNARVTRVNTPHGSFVTPVFMPVGTRAGVNNMMTNELLAAGTQIILGGNTYHMLCAPGMEVIEQAGGMHPFMGWDGPMLTDSGGFQIFSLSKNQKLCTIDEYGAHFVIPGQERTIHMTPRVSLETQKIIGADIIMAFDQCTPDHSTYDEVAHIMTRTHRWLRESIDYHHDHPTTRYGLKQALFGIIQGGLHPALRRESADVVTSMNPDGLAIGGETIGFNMKMTVDVIQWVREYLPQNKPRYTMGVGMSPQDLFDVVEQGIDLFDCVAPTRNARHGALYCGQVVPHGHWLRFESEHENERIQIKKACYAQDESPVMPDCLCYTCQHHSRAYLHWLFKEKASVFTALASIHNIHVLHDVCAKMRSCIESNAVHQQKKEP